MLDGEGSDVTAGFWVNKLKLSGVGESESKTKSAMASNRYAS